MTQDTGKFKLSLNEASTPTFIVRSDQIPLSTAVMMIGLQFVPQLILALVTTIGCSWSSMKLIPYHPETLLLPSGTQIEDLKKVYGHKPLD